MVKIDFPWMVFSGFKVRSGVSAFRVWCVSRFDKFDKFDPNQDGFKVYTPEKLKYVSV